MYIFAVFIFLIHLRHKRGVAQSECVELVLYFVAIPLIDIMNVNCQLFWIYADDIVYERAHGARESLQAYRTRWLHWWRSMPLRTTILLYFSFLYAIISFNCCVCFFFTFIHRTKNSVIYGDEDMGTMCRFSVCIMHIQNRSVIHIPKDAVTNVNRYFYIFL